jgi:hypothetical protein
MTGGLPNIAASQAGSPLVNAQRADQRRREVRRTEPRARGQDEYLPEVDQAQAIDAVRSSKDAADEEGREDHDASGGSAQAQTPPKPGKRIDLSA